MRLLHRHLSLTRNRIERILFSVLRSILRNRSEFLIHVIRVDIGRAVCNGIAATTVVQDA